jgi:hypothetical protein
MPVIPVTQEVDTGGYKFKASPGKVSETLSKKKVGGRMKESTGEGEFKYDIFDTL